MLLFVTAGRVFPLIFVTMDERIKCITEYIDLNPDRVLPVSELAEVACMSPKHFQRTFRKNIGITPALYVEKTKIKKSLDLIREPVPVYEIAWSLGYQNYETFSRAFRKQCRMAPSELQLLVRRIEDSTDPDAPVVISHSTNPDHLSALVTEAVKKKFLQTHHLPNLQVCIIRPNPPSVRSRKIESKYSFSFQESLVPEILHRISN